MRSKTRPGKTTAADIEVLTCNSADTNDRVVAIMHISFDKLKEYEPLLVKLTTDSDIIVRGQAFASLLGPWDRNVSTCYGQLVKR